MPHYLYQANYSSESIKGLVAKPEDRTEAIRAVVDTVGGTLHGCWLSLGSSDIVVIAEAENDRKMLAIAMAVAASGAVENGSTTRLVAMDDAVDGMRDAAAVLQRYAAPGS